MTKKEPRLGLLSKDANSTLLIEILCETLSKMSLTSKFLDFQDSISLRMLSQ